MSSWIWFLVCFKPSIFLHMYLLDFDKVLMDAFVCAILYYPCLHWIWFLVSFQSPIFHNLYVLDFDKVPVHAFVCAITTLNIELSPYKVKVAGYNLIIKFEVLKETYNSKNLLMNVSYDHWILKQHMQNYFLKRDLSKRNY